MVAGRKRAISEGHGRFWRRNLCDKDATLREAARALREGGRFKVSDIIWTKERPDGAIDLEEWSGCIAGALPLEEFLVGLRNAGFVEPRADSVRYLDEDRGLASVLISAEKPGA